MVDYAENTTNADRVKYRKHFPENIELTSEQETNCTSVVCLVTSQDLGSIALINKSDSRDRELLAFPGGSKLSSQTSEMAARDICFDKLDIQEEHITNIYPFWAVKKKQPEGYTGSPEYTIYYCIVLDAKHPLRGSAMRSDNPAWHPYMELSYMDKKLFDWPRSREVLLKTGMKFRG